MIVDHRHGSKREEISYSVELCCLLATLQNVTIGSYFQPTTVCFVGWNYLNPFFMSPY